MYLIGLMDMKIYKGIALKSLSYLSRQLMILIELEEPWKLHHSFRLVNFWPISICAGADGFFLIIY